MLIVDAHCDTASVLLDQQADFYENSCHVDLKRLLAYGSRVQFFASFSNPTKFQNSHLLRVLSIIDGVYRAQEKYADFFDICLNAGEIDRALANGKIAAVLTLEGGEALHGEISSLRQLYRLGVRSMMLTWNYRNQLADGAMESTGAGLSDFGREVVCEMNRLGMILDMSHLSKAGFYEAIELSKAPVIASHSNAKAVCDHPRNLSDEQLLELKRNGGVAGVNFYPYFLNHTDKAGISDVIRHIEHICSLTGEDHIGIGTDFDGIECTPEGLEGVQFLYRLFDRLIALNYRESFLMKFAGQNFMRVIRQVLG